MVDPRKVRTLLGRLGERCEELHGYASRETEDYLADRLQNVARFRNLLVHEYADVDDERVHGFLADDLEDLREFASAVYEAFPEV